MLQHLFLRNKSFSTNDVTSFVEKVNEEVNKSTYLGLNLPSEEDLMQVNTLTQNFEILDTHVSGLNSSMQSIPTESAFYKLMLGKGTFHMDMEIFMKSGVFDPNKYGLKIGQLIHVLAVGGGGGGGRGALTTSTDSHASGGGGGSGFVELLSMKLESLDLITVTVGNGGSGAVNNDAATNGEATTFGEYLTALGGVAGANGVNNKGGIGGDGYCKGKSGVDNVDGGFIKGGRGYFLGESLHAAHTEVDDTTFDQCSVNGFGGGGYGARGKSSISIPDSQLKGSPGASGVCIVTW